MRDYVFLTSTGESVQLSDFRGRWNLLILALPGPIDPAKTHFLQSLGQKSQQVRENETRVLVVTQPAQLQTVVNLAGDFRFLCDPDGKAMQELGADDAAVVYITDKFRELIHRIDTAETVALPTAEEIVSWTEFAAIQCPECHPPEWPADEVA